MFLARVVGDVVATVKHRALFGRRLVLVQPLGGELEPRGARVIAIDAAQAGSGNHVLVLDEGNGAAQVLGRPRGPVRTVVVGIVDEVAGR